MDQPPTEAPHPHSTQLDRLSALDLVRLMNAADRTVADAVGRVAPAIAQAIDAIATRLRAGGRLFYVGAGSSGRLGILDAAECPPTFGVSPDLVQGVIAGGHAALFGAVEGAEDRRDDGARDLAQAGVTARDVVVGIAASGRTPYVIGAIVAARAAGALTVGVTAVQGSELASGVEIGIVPETGPEILAGSTRLKAGTAAKLVLNMLSTGAMVQLGRSYGNRMVDVVATNAKLRARALAIVREVAGCSVEDATQALAAAGQSARTAIVIASLGVSADEARARLERAGGRLRDVIETRTEQASAGATPSLVLGVDGGASKTVAWIAAVDAGAPPLGRGVAGPGNPRSVGFAEAEANIDSAIDAAWADAGLPRRTLDVAVLSLAGVGRAEERESLQTWAQRGALAEHVVVTDDAESVLMAGAPDHWGIALICGTGTLALGRNAAGDVERAGGWGYLLGDEGSAYDIALAGLRAAVRATDGRGPATSLTPAFLAHFGVSASTDLVGQIYREAMTRDRLAALATIVFAEASTGDWTAAGIVDAACADLVRLVTTIATRLKVPAGSYPLALAGSVLRQQPSLRQLLVDSLGACGMAPGSVHVVTDPAAGAIALARRVASTSR